MESACWVQEETHNPDTLSKRLDVLVKQISKAIQSTCQVRPLKPRIQLLEVFCHEHSELTKQVRNLGGKAVRIGKAQGDLSTSEGRAVLFESVFMERPKHIWYSPTCSPWCAWSSFNEKRSMVMFHDNQRARREHLYQLALGIVLMRITRMMKTHLHWEQPRKSLMFRLPLLQEVFAYTQEAHFDMCRVGGLVCPDTGKFIQKSMAVRTSPRQVFEALHGRLCRRDHEHRAIEGTVKTLAEPPVVLIPKDTHANSLDMSPRTW